MDWTDKKMTCPHDDDTCPVRAKVQQLELRCKELESLSQLDGLTGFFNYRFLINSLEGEIERTNRTGLPTGLIMVDLDYFKKINDSYGHENGNLALKRAADIWRGIIRRIDIPCRYGGEEFIIILPGTRLPQAVQTAERLRQALENDHLQINGKTVSLTGSFGVAAFEHGPLTAESFIDEADRFVLEAKSQGRNRVCFDRTKVDRPETQITEEEKSLLFKKRSIRD